MNPLMMLALRARLGPHLPKIEAWIDAYLDETAGDAQSLASLRFARLPIYFSAETLERTRVVASGDIRKPPLTEWGLDDFRDFEEMDSDGITYKETFFVAPRRARDESLHFHELVHVIQWRTAGVHDFVVAYAAGLAKFGYWESPLEVMAYSLQARFDAGEEMPDVEPFIERTTRAIVADPLSYP